MKKLLTVLVAATSSLFAFGAFADFITSGTSFEDYDELAVGAALDMSKDDDGEHESARYWYSTESVQDGVVLSNYTETAAVDVPISHVYRPDEYQGADNNNYLKVETTSPIYRSAEVNSQDGTFTPVTIPDGGIYFDTLVQFTPADNVFDSSALNVGQGDKIAVSYVEREEDGDVPALTNFVIRAGYIKAPTIVEATNYIVKVPAGFAADTTGWHRLTIRTITNINGSGNVGFVVYLDNEALEYDDVAAEAAQTAGDGFTPEGVAANYYSATKKALFPSAVATGGSKTTISAAIFSGTGALDDLIFTVNKPAFIVEGIPVTFTGTNGVSAITVNGEPVDLADATVTLPAGTTSFTLGVTANTAEGYTYTGYTIGETSYGPADTTVTVGGASALTIEITTSRDNFSYVDSEDATQRCATLAGAIENAKAGTTITLLSNYVVANFEDVDFEFYAVTKSFTLDLNGHTLDGGAGDSNPLFYVTAGSLTVIDSVGGGKIVYSGNAEEGETIFYDGNGGAVIVGATSGDNGAAFDGILFTDDGGTTLSIIRGKFSAAENTDGDAFLWETAVVQDSESSGPTDGYWVVAPAGGGSDYPDYIDTSDATIKGQYDAWKTTYGADTTSAYEAAFLLNVAPDATDQTLDPVSIEIDGTAVKITMDHGNVNGYPFAKVATTPTGVDSASPIAVTIGSDGKVDGLATGGAPAKFFKIGISATPISVAP